MSKKALVDNIFKPNKDGVSEWISREELSSTPLALSKNGNMRHGVLFGVNYYNWEVERGNRREISKMRTNGLSERSLISTTRPIRKDIDKYHKEMGCVVCGSHCDLVTDHKNDLYNDPRVLNIETQTIYDFQCLCTHCNLQKRQIAKKTRETCKRIGATTIPSLRVFGIDFIEGDDTYDEKDIYAMKGTYWYDPVAFMEHIRMTCRL